MKKIYLLLILCLVNIGAFAQVYYPALVTAPYGGAAQTICQNEQNTLTIVNYSICGTSGTGSTPLSVTPKWYLDGALVYTGTPFNTTSSSGTVTLPAGAFTYTYPGTFTGDNGLKCVLTWSGASPGACGGDSTATGDTTNITVNPVPDGITGYSSACASLTTNLSDATTGGTWSSANTSVATIGSLSGLVSGVTAGLASISYTLPTTCAAVITVTVTAAPPPAAITGVNIVCAGQTTTLSQASGVGYFSSSDNGLATVDSFSGVVTGVQMGTPTISYTIGNGCTTTRAVTVYPLAPITGADSMCKTSSTFLADVVGGGTWSSSFPGIATIDSVTGEVTATNGGPTTISYATTDGCITTTTINVVLIPPAISGIMHTCPGASTTLSDATTGGLWSSNNNGVATVSASTGKVHGVAADTVTIFYTVRPGCSVGTQVTVNPLPAPITGTSALCASVIDTLYDITGGGVWSSLTPALASVIDTSGIVTALAGGSAIIAYTLPITGCRRTDTITVHPLPVPVISYNFLTATFYVDPIYTSYQWYDSLQGLIPGATSPSLAALYTEYYYVVVTDTFGCVGASAHYHFDASTLGVADPAHVPARIFPNPASSIIHISAPLNVRGVITGIDGRTLIEQPSAKDIDISTLPDGMYFITLYDDHEHTVAIQKFIKQ